MNKVLDDLNNLGGDSEVVTPTPNVTAPAPTPTPTPDVKEMTGAPTVSVESMIAMMGSILPQAIAASVKEAVSGLKDTGKPETTSLSNGVTIPTPEDMLESPVMFASRGLGYMTRSYKRNGMTYIAPYKLIKFEETLTDIITLPNGQKDILHVCTYLCYSKKELEYLRNHPENGIKFTEKVGDNFDKLINDPMFVDTQKTLVYYNRAAAMPQDIKIQTAKSLGIDVNDPTVNVDYYLIRKWKEQDDGEQLTEELRRQATLNNLGVVQKVSPL